NEATLIGTFSSTGNEITSKVVVPSGEGTTDDDSGNTGDDSGNTGDDSDNTDEDSSIVITNGITATNENAEYPAANAIDGNLSTYWEGTQETASITKGLGEVKSVNTVVLKLNTTWGTRTQKIEVQISEDGQTFTTVKAAQTYTFDQNSGNIVTISFDTVSAGYVRLNMSENNGSVAPQIAEFSVSNETETTTPDDDDNTGGNTGESGDIGGDVITTASIGAIMPYTRYDSMETTALGGSASVVTSPDFDKMNIASQASEQSYITLPNSGSYAEWTVNTTGNGITMRFTLPDTADGMGQSGSLDVYVNGNKVKTVDLTSYYMWQYFKENSSGWNGMPIDSKNEGGEVPCFAFDEVHFMLDESLKAGDKIRIQSSGANGLTYGVDFLEIEEVGAQIAQPANSYSVVDYGAVPNDGNDDYNAIQNCISAADAAGADVYFPAGTYHIGQMWRLQASDMKITGAGMWHTNIQFTNANAGSGGISGNCNNIEFCNMYINSNLRSRYSQTANYKCFMDVWTSSNIHDVWEDHFECGVWFGDYAGSMEYCDNTTISNCRIRNNFADGVNFCQGTSNSTVTNCSIRNNGDDGLAMWNNNYMGAKDESNNRFSYNTIDFIWRAGGIAVYGGSGHKIHNNYIEDTFMSAGIHLNTKFSGHAFNNNTGIEFRDNVIVRSGCASDCWNEDFGAIDIVGGEYGTIKNISFINTTIYNAQHDAIRLGNYWNNNNMGPAEGIVFENTKVYGCGIDGETVDYFGMHAGALLKLNHDLLSPVTINGLEYANIAYAGNDGIFCNGSKGAANYTMTNVTNHGNNYTVVIPDFSRVGTYAQ
uniref:discoidin domain-containing protein n=1 Tax=Acetatifactor sp. TaxID=1872090 RepID=UPI004056DAD7